MKTKSPPLQPIVKWAGGKRWLLKHIDDLMPDLDLHARFHEPFVGGGAVFWHLSYHGSVINDYNSDLINFYNVVRMDVDGLIESCGKLSSAYNDMHLVEKKEMYYAAREAYNDTLVSMVDRAAHFLFLNKTCFNGLYRVNSDNRFNVPWGKRKKFRVNEDLLRAATVLLKNTAIFNTDYREALDFSASAGDVVFLDPPYPPISDTSSFQAYTADGSSFSYSGLYEQTVKLDQRFIKFILTLPDLPWVRRWWGDWCEIKEFTTRHDVAADANSRSEKKELVIKNG